MGPIEVLWGILVLMFALVGLARGYNRELGSTIIILVGLVVLKLLEPTLTSIIGAIFRGSGQSLILLAVFQLMFVAIVFAGYAGETLVFRGQPGRGSSSVFFNVFFGALNGVLITGTLWYYLAKFNYPLPKTIIDATQLTAFAKNIIKYLPPNLPLQLLVGVLAFLLIMRVRK